MNSDKKAFLLVGSLRGSKSTSAFIGEYLLDLLVHKGFRSEKMYINDTIAADDKSNKFMIILNNADVVIFSTPLYIDCEPYLIIKIMEGIVEARRNKEGIKKQRFIVISNGGYPETQHNNTVLPIYRNFALESGFEWSGGLAFGMGAAFSVPLVRKISFMMRNIKKSLSIVATSILHDKPIPKNAVELMGKPLVPIWAYSAIARGIARFFSITNGAGNIYNMPIKVGEDE